MECLLMRMCKMVQWKRNLAGFNTIIHEFNLRNFSPTIGYILSHNRLQNKVLLGVQKNYPRKHASTNNLKQISYLQVPRILKLIWWLSSFSLLLWLLLFSLFKMKSLPITHVEPYYGTLPWDLKTWIPDLIKGTMWNLRDDLLN